MPVKHVLIDYENVQPDSMASLDQEPFRAIVFVGASQAKVSFEIAALIQRMGERGRYVKIAGNGPNSLDFHIAFYIGKLSAADPDAHFFIVSKDTGFDPLITHLKEHRILACRVKTVAEITDPPAISALLPAAAKTGKPAGKSGKSAKAAKSAKTGKPALSEREALVLKNLRQRETGRPGTLKTLSSTIHALFQKKLSEKELSALLKSLQDRRWILLEGRKVRYSLPDGIPD